MRKKTFFCVVIAALFVICVIYKIKQTPYDFLVKHSGKEAAVAPEELLYQCRLEGTKILLFYTNSNGNASCAIIKKKIMGYKLLNISSELSLVREDKASNYMISSWDDRKDREWIMWGILRNQNIDQVAIGNNKADIVEIETYGIRFFYSVGENSFDDVEPDFIKK